MLAADRSLLEVNMRQSAIKLREKELNLYTDNFSAMATQAAVMAGFTTTCMIEISIPPDVNLFAKYFLHVSSIISICANLTCVSLSTITSIWGSGKALRGLDGSMDEAVDGISKERSLIFQCFAVGIGGILCTVCSCCFILMDFPISLFAVSIVIYAAHMISSNALRIQKKFDLNDQATRLDDLTKYPSNSMTVMQMGGSDVSNSNSNSNSSGQRHRKLLNEV